MQIAFYATTRTYAPVLAMHGFLDRMEPLREAFARGDTERMIDLALPMAGILSLAGTPEEVRARVKKFDGVADRLILGGAWVGTSPERARANHDLLIETFSPSARPV